MEIEQNINTIERRLFDSAKSKLLPISGSLELLPLCNMNCDMCYVRLSREEMERTGQMHGAGEWLSVAKQMKDAGVIFLLLTGGEPLLHPDFKEIYLGLKKMGFVLTVNTNGTLIDEDWAMFFAQNKPRKINISLYGSNSDTYKNLCHYDGYEKTVNAIRLLRSHDVHVRMNATIAKKNMDDVEDLIRLSQELDALINVDSYLQPSVREREKEFDLQSRMTPEEAAQINFTADKLTMSPEGFRTMLESKVQYAENFSEKDYVSTEMSCLAGKCSFTINWQGEMRPCVIMGQPGISVFEHSFEEAWKFLTEETKNIHISEKCGRCRYRTFCHICAASALYETGSFNGVPEYLCRYSEESYRLFKEEYARIQENL